MTANLPPPSEEMRRLVDIVGAEAAFALIEAHGGTRFYVPKNPNERLISLIGEMGARALSQAWGGEPVKLPLARTWRILGKCAPPHIFSLFSSPLSWSFRLKRTTAGSTAADIAMRPGSGAAAMAIVSSFRPSRCR
jgi:hypothetical protein